LIFYPDLKENATLFPDTAVAAANMEGGGLWLTALREKRGKKERETYVERYLKKTANPSPSSKPQGMSSPVILKQ